MAYIRPLAMVKFLWLHNHRTYIILLYLVKMLMTNLPHTLWFTIQIVLTLEAEELFPTVIRRRLVTRTKEVFPNKLGLYHWFADAWGADRWDSVDNIRKHTQQELVCG